MTITSLGVSNMTQGTSAPTIAEAFAGVAVGDLSVIQLLCNSTQGASTINYAAGGDAGYTEILNTAGTSSRVRRWAKVVVAGDLTSGEMKSLTMATWDSVGTNAITWEVIHSDQNVFPNTTVHFNGAVTDSQAATPWLIGDYSDVSRAAYAIYGISTASGGADLQAKFDDASWDGSGSNDPTWPEATLSNSRQGGHKIYAASDTLDRLMAHNQRTTNKAASVSVWQEPAPPPLYGEGKGAAAASAKGELLATKLYAEGKGAAAGSAKGEVFVADAVFAIEGKGAAAASAKGTADLLPHLASESTVSAAATAVGELAISNFQVSGKGAAAASAFGSLLATKVYGDGKGPAAASAKGSAALLTSGIESIEGKGAAAASAFGALYLIPLIPTAPTFSLRPLINWQLLAYRLGTREPLGELPFETLSFDIVRNEPGGWTATVPTERITPTNTDDENVFVVVTRNDAIAFTGFLTTRRSDTPFTRFQLGGPGALDYYDRRELRDDLDFTDEDQLDVVEAVLANCHDVDAYANPLGTIIRRRSFSGVQRTLEYVGDHRISYLKILTDLGSTLDGFDMALSAQWGDGRSMPTHTLELIYPRRDRRPDITLDDGPRAQLVNWESDSSEIANRTAIDGTGLGGGHLLFDADLSADPTHPVLRRHGARYDLTEAWRDHTHGVFLGQLLGAINARAQAPARTATYRTVDGDVFNVGELLPGDIIPCYARRGPIEINGNWRVEAMTLSVRPDSAIVDVTVSDRPLTAYATRGLASADRHANRRQADRIRTIEGIL